MHDPRWRAHAPTKRPLAKMIGVKWRAKGVPKYETDKGQLVKSGRAERAFVRMWHAHGQKRRISGEI